MKGFKGKGKKSSQLIIEVGGQISCHPPLRASLTAHSVKNLPAMQETWVQFLGQEDPLEKEMANGSSVLARRNSWTEEPGGLLAMASQGVDHN